MTKQVRLPQLPQSEKDRREENRKREMAIEDARNEAFLRKLNRQNGIGVKRR